MLKVPLWTPTCQHILTWHRYQWDGHHVVHIIVGIRVCRGRTAAVGALVVARLTTLDISGSDATPMRAWPANAARWWSCGSGNQVSSQRNRENQLSCIGLPRPTGDAVAMAASGTQLSSTSLGGKPRAPRATLTS